MASTLSNLNQDRSLKGFGRHGWSDWDKCTYFASTIFEIIFQEYIMIVQPKV